MKNNLFFGCNGFRVGIVPYDKESWTQKCVTNFFNAKNIIEQLADWSLRSRKTLLCLRVFFTPYVPY